MTGPERCGAGHLCCDEPDGPPLHDHFLTAADCPACGYPEEPSGVATSEGVLSYAIGYAERRAGAGQIAAVDVLAGLAELGWTAAPDPGEPVVTGGPVETAAPERISPEALDHVREIVARLAAGHPDHGHTPDDQLEAYQRQMRHLWALNLESCLAAYVPALLAQLDALEARTDVSEVPDLLRRCAAGRREYAANQRHGFADGVVLRHEAGVLEHVADALAGITPLSDLAATYAPSWRWHEFGEHNPLPACPGDPDPEPTPSAAEEKIVGLMAALETSVREAKEARDRHRAQRAGDPDPEAEA